MGPNKMWIGDLDNAYQQQSQSAERWRNSLNTTTHIDRAKRRIMEEIMY